MLHENEILEAIDCTPNWQTLLPVMLDLWAQDKAKIKNSYKVTDKTQRAIDNCSNMLIEFKKMAQAADKWNEHCKIK